MVIIKQFGITLPDGGLDDESNAYMDWLTQTQEEFLRRQQTGTRDLLKEYLNLLIEEKTNGKNRENITQTI